ncbi:hypothetical protein [Hymenobacter weizhouensis]|uniref:hypothetical protein n=1 Tax=Hymenobacter sp. YIM 151500-1 TaxID=2987689 RepID=UPI00222752D3|nr:hypothetical protein [Hymenobacter sp. YIM 151500-1]UYZ62215.1 hypothetical protein OIS53_14575 [Hymenobacter sp. YIM 151500-1]
MTLTQRIVRPALVTAGLLLVPLVAMQFTQEVAWTLSDFIVAGALLFGTGLAYELITSQRGNGAYRLAAGVALATALLLVWVNLAVGLIGSEDNPANLLYGGVLAVGLVGAIIARFRPRGMARTMLAAALVQFLVPIIALLIWKPELTLGVAKVFGANALFVVLWLGAALLFRRASSTGL